jgi:hypothetical protein
MHEPKPKRKISSEINIYREACRNLVANHPKLSPLRRVILMRLTHYINRHTWDAYVSEETLAKDCRAAPRTVRRALKAARRLNILERTRRGTQWSGPSHHVFKVSQPDSSVLLSRQSQPDTRSQSTGQAGSSQPDSSVRITSEEHLNNLTAPPSSSCNSSAVAKEEKRSGEEERVSIPSSDNQTSQQAEPDYRDIKKAILSVWPIFSASTLSRHMQTYGAAKTLEVVECAARLQEPDINKVLEKPLMAWSAPQVTETAYAPADEIIEKVHIPGPVPQRYWRSRQRSKGEAASA